MANDSRMGYVEEIRLVPGFALDGRAYFLLLHQKKVAKENEVSAKPKGDPAPPSRLRRDPLRYAIAPGGCGTRCCAAQTVLAETPGTMALLGGDEGGGVTLSRMETNRSCVKDYGSLP